MGSLICAATLVEKDVRGLLRLHLQLEFFVFLLQIELSDPAVVHLSPSSFVHLAIVYVVPRLHAFADMEDHAHQFEPAFDPTLDLLRRQLLFGVGVLNREAIDVNDEYAVVESEFGRL